VSPALLSSCSELEKSGSVCKMGIGARMVLKNAVVEDVRFDSIQLGTRHAEIGKDDSQPEFIASFYCQQQVSTCLGISFMKIKRS
jgi:hypothetical protein